MGLPEEVILTSWPTSSVGLSMTTDRIGTPMTTPGFLRWRSWGAAERRALLLHDAGSSSGTWWRAAEALARAGWRVKAPDLPSHGASPRLAAPINPEVAAAWLVGDLADRPIDLVVGHGFGAAVALALVDRGPILHRVVLEEYPETGHHWPTAADDLIAAADRARRDADRAYADFRRHRPDWGDDDCRQAVRDLAACAVEEVADGLRSAHTWPRPTTDLAASTQVVVSTVSHRHAPDAWVAQFTELTPLAPAG